MGDRREDEARPRAPGWYPDPWSATGEGKRYFDGKKWGSTEPLARHTTSLEEALRAQRPRARRRARSKSVPRRPSGVRTVVILVVLVAVAWALPRFRNQDSDAKKAAARPATAPTTRAPNRPPPPGEPSTPIGTPAAVPAGSGGFEVLQHQPGDTTTPVAFDPCRPIHYVVNLDGAPSDGLALTQSAVARVQSASSLQFVYDGTTTETASKDRAAYQPDRYDPSRWAPVLIAWTDEAAFPSLAGYIAGIGQPQAVYAPDERLVYVTGLLALDREQLSELEAPDRTAIVLHELGHLVGLDHTTDRAEIMCSESQFNVRDYADGDLRGLALLGTQACFPDV